MRVKNIAKLASFLVVLISFSAISAKGQDFTNIQWGDVAGSDFFLLGDSSGSTFNPTTNQAIVVLGYFNSAFNVSENATDLQALFDNFTLLAQAEIGTGYSGFVSTSTSISTDGNPAVGQTPYYWVLEGVTTYDLSSVLGVSEYAILSDSNWGVIPTGAAPPAGQTYDIRVVNPDTVIYGSVENGAGFGSGNLYKTAEAVPEPAFYTAGLGVIALLVVQLHRRRKVA
ncbi:MAG: hypothetical protein Q7Q73_14250 [Verrucomicrobiota bacterium JB024]|nr:hypothetical protein [Verrucomicrobiota bacterium JB024]